MGNRAGFTLGELAEALLATLEGDPARIVTGVEALDAAGVTPQQKAFVRLTRPLGLLDGTVLLAALFPLGLFAALAPPLDGLVAVQLGATVCTLVFLLLAEGFGRSVYFGVPLVLSVGSFVGSLACARFFDRLE